MRKILLTAFAAAASTMLLAGCASEEPIAIPRPPSVAAPTVSVGPPETVVTTPTSIVTVTVTSQQPVPSPLPTKVKPSIRSSPAPVPTRQPTVSEPSATPSPAPTTPPASTTPVPPPVASPSSAPPPSTTRPTTTTPQPTTDNSSPSTPSIVTATARPGGATLNSKASNGSGTVYEYRAGYQIAGKRWDALLVQMCGKPGQWIANVDGVPVKASAAQGLPQPSLTKNGGCSRGWVYFQVNADPSGVRLQWDGENLNWPLR